MISHLRANEIRAESSGSSISRRTDADESFLQKVPDVSGAAVAELLRCRVAHELHRARREAAELQLVLDELRRRSLEVDDSRRRAHEPVPLNAAHVHRLLRGRRRTSRSRGPCARGHRHRRRDRHRRVRARARRGPNAGANDSRVGLNAARVDGRREAGATLGTERTVDRRAGRVPSLLLQLQQPLPEIYDRSHEMLATCGLLGLMNDALA